MNASKTQYKKNDDGASIGIGAMIVFIALILVAAVASTIIIKTAEELQQRAEATGDDTRDEISGKLQIVMAYVSVDDNAAPATAADEIAIGATATAARKRFIFLFKYLHLYLDFYIKKRPPAIQRVSIHLEL